MKCVSVIFAILALAIGLKAAFTWYQASRVEIDPGWTSAHPEPVDEILKQMAWNSAIIGAARKSSELNRVAAFWTAVSIVFGGISNVAGSLIHLC